MKLIRKRSLKAMGLGLLASLLTALIWVLVCAWIDDFDSNTLVRSVGTTLYISLWAGLIVMAGWMLVVLPVTYLPRAQKWLGHLYLNEIIWILMAEIAYLILIASWLGESAVIAAWIPAAIGLFAGLGYRWLNRKEVRP